MVESMVRTPRFDRGPAARRRWLQRLWRRSRYILLLGLLLLAWQLWSDPQMRARIGLPVAEGELVTTRFPLCDAPGYARNCVVDGDTFRIGNRRIRIEGIDAPEREGRCPAESEAAVASTRALARWLNSGPFHMLPEGSVPRDQYGRELQTAWRVTEDGRYEDLADILVHTGHAVEFGRGGASRWCD